jgi:hypothetical protein
MVVVFGQGSPSLASLSTLGDPLRLARREVVGSTVVLRRVAGASAPGGSGMAIGRAKSQVSARAHPRDGQGISGRQGN